MPARTCRQQLETAAGGAAELRRYEQLTKRKEGQPTTQTLHTYAALENHDASNDFSSA